MTDLVIRLSAELDRREEWLRRRDGHRNPDDGGYYSCAAVREYSIDGEPTGSDAYCDCGYVAQRGDELRLIEAHRKIVDLHAIVWRDIGWLADGDEEYAEIPVCGLCVPKHAHFSSRDEVPEGPCQTVKIVAEGYGLTLEEGT